MHIEPPSPTPALVCAPRRSWASRLGAEIAWVTGQGTPSEDDAHRAAVADADAAVEKLHQLFFATPYRPTGLATDARAVVRLVDELRWLNTIILRSAPGRRPRDPDPQVCRVKVAAAVVMEAAA